MSYEHKQTRLLVFPLQEDADPQVVESLSIENTLWASTVVASGKRTMTTRIARFLSRNLD